MQPQIVHESEVHRQHVRLKIPIQIEIDGIRYQVDDWSIGGFGVESVMTSRQPGKRFPVRLIFTFEEFDMIMRLDARMVYVDHDHGRFGCAFTSMTKEHAEIVRYLVDAFLAGEVVSAGDILQVRARDNHLPTRIQPIYQPDLDDDSWTVRRRYGAFAALGVAGLALLAVIFLGLKERYFTIATDSAVIDAPVVEIRSPVAGRFISALASGGRVFEGTLLGTVQALDGTVVTLESPCDCLVLERLALSGLHYQAGADLMALVRAGQPLMVRAPLPLEQAERLELGDRAEIRLPGRAEPLYGQIERIDFRPGLAALRDPSEEPPSRRLAQVVVRPDRPFAFGDVGVLVSVRFL
ncbi:MAG: PilZ domain-containing protein [Geminicoccaceae bacterium]